MHHPGARVSQSADDLQQLLRVQRSVSQLPILFEREKVSHPAELEPLDEDRALLYFDLIETSLSDAARLRSV